MTRPAPHIGSRILQLDTLRGIAALLVVIHHSLQAFAGSTADVWTGLAGHLDVGRCGVVIFFMISGFVIVKAVPGTDLKAAATFWKHRFFRLYPPFWVSVALAVLVAGLVGASDCCAFSVPVTPAALIANLTMFPLRFHQPMLIGIYWTLELEVLFYGLITAFAVSRRLRFEAVAIMACILFAGAVATAGLHAAQHGATEIGKDQLFMALLHLSLMFSGAALRFHWDRQETRASFLIGMPLLLVLYFAAVAAFFAGVVAIKVRHGVDAHTFRVAGTYLLAITAFLACLRWGKGSRIGRMMGDRSYGIYLLHLPIMGSLSLAIARMPALTMGYVPFLLVELGLTLIAADLLRRLVERPAIRLGHRADRQRGQAAVPLDPLPDAALAGTTDTITLAVPIAMVAPVLVAGSSETADPADSESFGAVP